MSYRKGLLEKKNTVSTSSKSRVVLLSKHGSIYLHSLYVIFKRDLEELV